jgi:hypothetical protein
MYVDVVAGVAVTEGVVDGVNANAVVAVVWSSLLKLINLLPKW